MKNMIIATTLALLAGGVCFGQNDNRPSAINTESIVFNVTAAPSIPDTMRFAGELVSFDRLDMAERMDRELLSVVYGQTSTLLCFKRANRYFPVLAPILQEQGVPLDFLYMAVTESSMDPLAYSSAKAAGLWQLLAGTARDYGLEVSSEVDQRYDPELSTRAACRYLKWAYKRYGHWPTVCAGYNAGVSGISERLSSQRVDNSFDLFMSKETSRYVFRIFAYKLLMENPKRYGYRLSRYSLWQPVECDVVTVSTGVDWVQWAKGHHLTYNQLRELNPWIRRETLTNASGKTYQVRVPKDGQLQRSTRDFVVYDENWVVD